MTSRVHIKNTNKTRISSRHGSQIQPRPVAGSLPTGKPGSSQQPKVPLPTTTQNMAPRLKGKARKLAKVAAQSSPAIEDNIVPKQVKYVVTIQELLNQVGLVAKAPSAAKLMPARVHRALQAAIDARERCAVWFERTNLALNHLTMAIVTSSVFCRGLWTSCRPVPPSPPQVSSHQKPQMRTMLLICSKLPMHPSSILRSLLTHNRNAFAALDVQDTVSDSEDSNVTSQTTETATEQQDRTRRVYELEVDRGIELAFMVFSFFEDVHRLRADLKAIWTRFHAGALHILHATVLTTAALDLVRQMEEEVYSAYLSVNGSDSSRSNSSTYQDLLAAIYNADSLGRGDEPDLVTGTVTVNVAKNRKSAKQVSISQMPDQSMPPPNLNHWRSHPLTSLSFCQQVAS